LGTAENLLGDEMMSLLPAALRHCLTEPKWWEDELQGLHVVRALTALVLPADCHGYRLVDNPPSPRWDWQGHALVHKSSLLHTGVNLFGPVLIGPDCEIGPNASIFGPTVIEGRSYLGPSVEIRRCLLLARAEVSHMSFLGHSVIGRRAALGAFFCSAVRDAGRYRRAPAWLRHRRRRGDRCAHDGHAGPPDHRDLGNTPELPDHEELLTSGNHLRQIPRGLVADFPEALRPGQHARHRDGEHEHQGEPASPLPPGVRDAPQHLQQARDLIACLFHRCWSR
jgi:hypothetical protein